MWASVFLMFADVAKPSLRYRVSFARTQRSAKKANKNNLNAVDARISRRLFA
jgi:hypothetical protein